MGCGQWRGVRKDAFASPAEGLVGAESAGELRPRSVGGGDMPGSTRNRGSSGATGGGLTMESRGAAAPPPLVASAMASENDGGCGSCSATGSMASQGGGGAMQWERTGDRDRN